MAGDVAEDGIQFLQAVFGELVADATVCGEDRVLSYTDNLADAHAGFEAEGKETSVAWIRQELDDRFDFFSGEDFCLTGHRCKEVDEFGIGLIRPLREYDYLSIGGLSARGNNLWDEQFMIIQ